jgi:hypothetical protein
MYGGYIAKTVSSFALLHIAMCSLAQSAESQVTESPAEAASPQPRGYSIPTLDLSDHKHRQTIVDREAGQYLGHPTTVLLEDNKTILTVYPKGHGRGAIVYKRSTDGGLTWSERLPTPESWSTSKEVPTIHRVIDAEGKILPCFTTTDVFFVVEKVLNSVSLRANAPTQCGC